MSNYPYLDKIDWDKYTEKGKIVIIKNLKRKAYNVLYEYNRRKDSYHCDDDLACYLSSKLHRLKSEFNAIVDKMSQVDSSCPKIRL